MEISRWVKRTWLVSRLRATLLRNTPDRAESVFVSSCTTSAARTSSAPWRSTFELPPILSTSAYPLLHRSSTATLDLRCTSACTSSSHQCVKCLHLPSKTPSVLFLLSLLVLSTPLSPANSTLSLSGNIHGHQNLGTLLKVCCRNFVSDFPAADQWWYAIL